MTTSARWSGAGRRQHRTSGAIGDSIRSGDGSNRELDDPFGEHQFRDQIGRA